MQPTPVSLSVRPALAASMARLIEAGGHSLGPQSWADALEALHAIQHGMQAAAQRDQERIAALETKATTQEPAT